MFASIQLNSNRPDNIREFVDNVNTTASNPSAIEILFHIDKGDEPCRNLLENLKTTSAAKIKYLETDIIKGYKDLWKPLNELLKITDPNVYFITNFSDEFRFETKDWDGILKKYIHYYADDIFRIRLSRYRFRNYKDSWECVFAPDSLAFYTKKWMDIVATWCPCLGPDSWQQMVAFYLINSRKFDHIHYNRDIAEPFIKFSGEGASIGLTGLKARQRIKDNVDLWFETVSLEMQEKAKRAAALLQTNIIMHEGSEIKNISHNFIANKKPAIFTSKDISAINFQDNKKKKQIEFFFDNKIIYKISYKINKIWLSIINNVRKPNYGYFAGGGEECFRTDIISQINVYFRMRKYGAFGHKPLIYFPSKPKLFRKHKLLSILWTPIKIFLVLGKIILKITKTEKYFRFLQMKIRAYKAEIRAYKIKIEDYKTKMGAYDYSMSTYDYNKSSLKNSPTQSPLLYKADDSLLLLRIVRYPFYKIACYVIYLNREYIAKFGVKGIQKPSRFRKKKVGIFWPLIKTITFLKFTTASTISYINNSIYLNKHKTL